MKTKKVPKQRNLLHNHPMMMKCAVHGKSKKAKRRSDKMAFRRDMDKGSFSLAA
jgi:hypothetical protein